MRIGSVAEFKRLETDNFFTTDDRDGLEAKKEREFCDWQVERLLNSAADLLDRALADKATYLSLREKSFGIAQDVERMARNVEHQTQRMEQVGTPASALDQPVQKLEARQADNLLLTNEHEAMVNAANALNTFWASKTGSDARLTETVAGNLGSAVEAHRARIEYIDFMREAKFAFQDTTLARQELKRQQDAIKLSTEQLEEIRREIAPGGALDFIKQADITFARIRRDCLEAGARLCAGSAGFTKLFGSRAPSPYVFEPGDVLEAVDSSVEWVREALYAHALLAQHEQSFTACLSIKEVLGASWHEFTTGEAKQWSQGGKFFDQWQFVRIRGIMAVWHGTGEMVPIALRVSVPNLGRIVGCDDPINQSFIPKCVLGRVEHSSSPREPEVCGGVSLMNASPLSANDGNENYNPWTIEILSKPLQANVSDISLQIQCVGLFLKAGK